MKVQSRTDELNPLRAVSSGSDLARSSANTELHIYSPLIILVFRLKFNSPKSKSFLILP